MNEIWFGTQASLQVVLDMEAALKADPQMYSSPFGQDEENTGGPESRLLEYHNNVAIVKVEGSLTNKNRWYNEWFGLTAYSEITDALAEAADDGSIDTIIMAYSSGGGTASGVKDAADFIKMVDKEHKPVYAYTKEAAFSAAYWLYSAARQTIASEMGQVGSIGALAIHTSVKDAYNQAGIVHTVFREGEFKALGQPVEKLDDKASGEIQEHLKKANSFFLDAVMEYRGLSMSEHANWGEGKTFYGTDGLRVGLVDQIRSLSKTIQRFMNTEGTSPVSFDGETAMADPTAKTGNVEEQLDGKAPAQTLVDEQTAAKLAAGIVPDVALVDNKAVPEKPAVADPAAPAEVPAVALEEKPEEEPAPAAAPAADAIQMAVELGKSQAQVEQLTAQLEASQGLVTSMTDIVKAAIDNKTVGMGSTPVDLSHMSPEMAVAHYAAVDLKFKKTFKIGATAATPVDTDLVAPVAKTADDSNLTTQQKIHEANRLKSTKG